MTSKYDKMITTINKWHAGQLRGNTPATEHCLNVSFISVNAMKMSKDIINLEIIEDIAVSALGHDLLEDTKITRDEIETIFGSRVLKYIDLLSNKQDDYHTDEYMKQIASAPEEVRIIKYADLIENTASVTYNLDHLGLDWGNDFFKPIMEKTLKILIDSKFNRYEESSIALNTTANLFTNLLREKLKG